MMIIKNEYKQSDCNANINREKINPKLMTTFEL